MHTLREGALRFRREIHAARRHEFEQLAEGQSPHTLFITCSDSRICPSLLTSTKPGELFVVRNAGNFVPSWRPGASSGEAASIEFAVRGLGVRDVVVCGHSSCGAVKAALAPQAPDNMPALGEWLPWGFASRHAGGDVAAAVQANVLAQVEHLLTHPAIAEARAAGKLQVHGWYYDIGSGEVREYSPESKRFVSLSELVEVTS